MKNKKIVTIFSITILLLILSIIVKPNYPEEYKPNSISSIGEITGNTIINQNFKSKLDVLDSIKIQYGTYTKKIESGSLNIKIYNGSKEIYQHEYQLNELSDNQILDLEFDIQKNVKNKDFHLEIETDSLEDPITFYSMNDVGKLTSTQKMNLIGNIRIIQHGQVGGYYYTIAIAIILLIEFLVYFIKKYNNDCPIIKHKFINNCIMLVASLILAVCFLDCRLDISNNFTLSLISFALLMLSSIVIIRNIIISYYSGQYEEMFLALAIPIGTFFFLALVPGVVPDEPFHYNIAYQMSKGNFFLSKYNEYVLNPKIASYTQVKEVILGNESIPFITSGLTRSGGYSILLYIPAAFGMFIAQLFGLPEILCVYAGSYCNFLMFLILGYLIIKYLPFGKLIGLVYLLNPMLIHQATSVSCDAVINSTCLLFISYVLNIKYSSKEINWKDGLILGILLLFVVVSKFAYFPLALLLLLIKDKLKIENKKINKKIVVPIAVFSILSVLAFIYVKRINPVHTVGRVTSDVPVVVNNNYTKNEYLMSNPLNVIYLGFNTAIHYLDFYITSFAGRSLGWLNINIPETIVYFYLFLLVLTVFLSKEKYELTKKEKSIVLIIWALNVMVVMGGLYYGFGNIRDILINGVQGRYFIPMNLLLLLVMFNRKNNLKWEKGLLFIIISISIINLLVISNIIDWFILL